MLDLAAALKQVRQGMIPAHIYSDKEIFELEKSVSSAGPGCSSRTNPRSPTGDYVVRRVLDDSFIITRDAKGDVRAMFNMCLHRGMQVCRAEMGNASNFRCPYHGWTYRNDGRLTGLPFHREAYGGEDGFPRQPNPASRTESRELQRPDLHQHGPRRATTRGLPRRLPVLSGLLHQTKRSGLEVRGPQRWRIKANWKIGAENFAGDMYHTPHTHASDRRDRLVPRAESQKRKDGATYWAQGGNHLSCRRRNFEERMRYVGYPDEMIDRHRALDDRQQRLVGDSGFMISAASCSPTSVSCTTGQGRRQPERVAVHLNPAVAADQRERDRGVFLVRCGLRGTAGVQEELL